VTILYTAPTTIRTLMKWGHEWPQGHDLSSLRLLGTVGEPINPEAWMWYREYIGGGKCPIVDTCGRPRPGHPDHAPAGYYGHEAGGGDDAFPGINADIVDNDGNSVGNGEGGYLVITAPWPA